MEKIIEVKVEKLYAFKNHPFHVDLDMELFELMRSIEREGVLVPLIARQNPYGDGYELIAGHRRKAAAERIGIKKVPVVIKEMDDDQSIIEMVDSNLQREHLKPSEKAFAYRMKLEALNRQGKRKKTTLCQLGTNLNPTVEVQSLEIRQTEMGYQLVNQNQENYVRKTSGDELAKQAGESRRQIYRFVRLTYLIPKILAMVDEKRIALTIGVELSYLTEEEQYELHAVMDLEQCTPSLSQANRMKRLSQKNGLDMDEIYNILEEEKPNQREQIKIREDTLRDYFPENYTMRQKIMLIQSLVKDWYESQQR